MKNVNPCEKCIVRPCCATKIIDSVRTLAVKMNCQFLMDFCEEADQDEINSVRETFGLYKIN